VNEAEKRDTGLLLSADRPIATRADDRLGRATYAAALARAIRNWRGDDSLVVGVCGPWGAGKTSVKNLVREALAGYPKAESPFVVDFNAWEFSGQDQLAEAFFVELGEALGRTDESERAKQLESSFKRLGRTLRFVGGMSGAMKAFLGLTGGVAAIAGAAGPEALLMGQAAAVTAEQVQTQLRDLGDAAERASEHFDQPRRGVAQLKSEITGLLREAGRNVLVFIDDIDRLSASEIRLLFRLVKVNGDLPKLVYVLLFQRDIVEKALEADTVVSGRDFLAKIVQAPFDLPKASRRQLNELLFEGLNEVLADARVEKTFRKDAWQGVFWKIEPYFRTVRDVRRFLVSLRFHVGLFLGNEGFEVNIVDLIGLEVLRVFEPDIYAALPAHKSILTGVGSSLGDRADARKKEAQRTLDELVSLDDRRRREQASELLKILYPSLGTFGSPGEQAERELRACSGKLFDRYFQLTVPEGEISQQHLERVIGRLGDRGELYGEFRRLHQQGLMVALVERLEALKETLDLQHAQAFVTALFDIGDELPLHREQMFEMEPNMHAARVVYWYLRREEDEEHREAILREAIQETKGLYLPCMLVGLEAQRDPASDGEGRSRLVRPARLKEFQRICAGKVAGAATGELADNPHLGSLLYYWAEWGDNQASVRTWVDELIGTPAGTLKLLAGLVQRGFSSGGVTRRHDYLSLKRLEQFADPEAIDRGMAGVQPEALGEAERVVLRSFQRSLRRRRLGRSEDPPFSFLEEDESNEA